LSQKTKLKIKKLGCPIYIVGFSNFVLNILLYIFERKNINVYFLVFEFLD